jgi:hypothetical protein
MNNNMSVVDILNLVIRSCVSSIFVIVRSSIFVHVAATIIITILVVFFFAVIFTVLITSLDGITEKRRSDNLYELVH